MAIWSLPLVCVGVRSGIHVGVYYRSNIKYTARVDLVTLSGLYVVVTL